MSHAYTYNMATLYAFMNMNYDDAPPAGVNSVNG
jgi:hypothetical protein